MAKIYNLEKNILLHSSCSEIEGKKTRALEIFVPRSGSPLRSHALGVSLVPV